MFYVGLDVHTVPITGCVLNSHGQVQQRQENSGFGASLPTPLPAGQSTQKESRSAGRGGNSAWQTQCRTEVGQPAGGTRHKKRTRFSLKKRA